jgi:AcrR family transcriptional regulator
MPPSPAPARQPLSRSSITETAKELFSQRGYANTTIEDIADRLGVRKGAVYYHVPRKSDLLIQVVTDLLRPIAQHAERISLEDASPRERLAAAVRSHVDQLVANQAAARIFFEQYRDLPPEDGAGLGELSARIEAAFDRILAAGISSGDFRPTPVQLLRMHVLALCNWPYRWFDPGGPYARSAIQESVWEHVDALVANNSVRGALQEEE